MVDVSIVGCGIVGMIHALLLAKQGSLSIAMLDLKEPQSTWKASAYDPRVYALTPASQAILQSLDLWPELSSKRASPFKRMSVWEAEGKGELYFDHAQLSVPALGYIVEENLLRELLYEKVKASAAIKVYCPATLTKISVQKENLQLEFSDREPLPTRLLVGADGIHSIVRNLAGIHLKSQDYQHSALIAQVETSLPHEQTARQRFIADSGPLAFLPLIEPHQSSIVWSTQPEQAKALLALSDEDFKVQLAQAFESRLGDISRVSQRYLFPLYERHAEHYVKERIALIGDAAHTLHPLAGQGLNLGIADAALLAETVLAAVSKNRSFYTYATLRPYERARKSHNQIMLQTVKTLKTLFTSPVKPLQALRTQGLALTNRSSLLKSFFANIAMS